MGAIGRRVFGCSTVREENSSRVRGVETKTVRRFDSSRVRRFRGTEPSRQQAVSSWQAAAGRGLAMTARSVRWLDGSIARGEELLTTETARGVIGRGVSGGNGPTQRGKALRREEQRQLLHLAPPPPEPSLPGTCAELSRKSWERTLTPKERPGPSLRGQRNLFDKYCHLTVVPL